MTMFAIIWSRRTEANRLLADAIGFMQNSKRGELPGFVRDWRARWDESGHWHENVSIKVA